jgi:hypothetical protein
MRLVCLLGVLTVLGCASAPHPRPSSTDFALCGNRSARRCAGGQAIARLLARAPLRIVAAERLPGFSHAQLFTFELPDGRRLRAKWKASGRGGDGQNRSPRHELAAWRVQQLLLAPDDAVVPPTALRCLDRDELRRWTGESWPPTFDGSDCVLGTLAFWLDDVEQLPRLDRDRLERDPAYRDAMARLNVVTYVIDHRDTKPSNFLFERAPEHAFAVDNGLAFSGFRSWRAYFVRDWSRLLVTSLPRDVVRRIRRLDRAALEPLLVMAQFEARDQRLAPVPIGAPIDADTGVRRAGNQIQLGLTRAELEDVAGRIEHLRALLDEKRLAVTPLHARRSAGRRR